MSCPECTTGLVISEEEVLLVIKKKNIDSIQARNRYIPKRYIRRIFTEREREQV